MSAMVTPTPHQRDFGNQDLPMAMGAVRGVRAFDIYEVDVGRVWRIPLPEPWVVHALAGMRAQLWNPGDNQAICLDRPRDPDHELVTLECTDGFYAYWTAKDMRRNQYAEVVGVIDGWGKTVIGSRGFRCEKAKIIGLAPDPTSTTWDPQVLEAVAALYGVPFYRTVTELLAAHPVERPDYIKDVQEPIEVLFARAFNAILTDIENGIRAALRRLGRHLP